MMAMFKIYHHMGKRLKGCTLTPVVYISNNVFKQLTLTNELPNRVKEKLNPKIFPYAF